jgi:hypothetical protein
MIQAVALGALLLGGPVEPASANHALGHAPIILIIDSCPDVPREELARLLALELETPVLATGQGSAPAVHVQVACAGTTVRLAVDDPAEGTALRRVTAFAPPRAGLHEDVTVRLVALAIAELVLTSRGALSVGRPPEAQVEALAPGPPQPPEGARPPGRAYVLAFGQALGPFSGVGLGWGGGLRVGWAFGRRWLERPSIRPVIDVEVAAAETSVDRTLGTVQVSLWSATLRALLRFGGGRVWLDAGGGGRFGLAQLRGEPSDATMARGEGVVGTWAGPVAYVGLGARLRRVVVELGVEGGRALRPVSGTVDEGPPLSIDGNWACATVAAGWGE